jgi:hypothetical protein
MEQLFSRHCYAFFQEFNVFRSHFSKAITSFLKLSLKLARLTYLLVENLIMLVLAQPTLYKWHSPTKKTVVMRKPSNVTWMRTL